MHSLSLQGIAGHELSVMTAPSNGGSADPALVFVHGFPLDHRMWLRQLEQPFDGVNTVVPELRGFGRSTLLVDRYSLADLADDIEIVRQRVCGGKRIILCGLSMGGYIAFEYWRSHRQHLSGLILCNTNPSSDDAATKELRRQLAQRVVGQGSLSSLQGIKH